MTSLHPQAILGAAIGAFSALAAAATISSPAAHADDVILADVTAIETAANTAFGLAATDLGGAGTEAAGLTQLFIGVDDYLIGIPSFLGVALTDELQGVPVISPTVFEFSFAAPTSIAQSITEAQSFYAAGAALITTIAGLPSTDFATTALDNTLSIIDQYILPGQIELIGSLAFNGL